MADLSKWTEHEWGRLCRACWADGLRGTEEQIREVAESYARHGSEGGGNQHGLAGTVVALNVDRIDRTRGIEVGARPSATALDRGRWLARERGW